MIRRSLPKAAIALGSLLAAAPLRAQVEQLPPSVRASLDSIGPAYQRDTDAAMLATASVFQPLLKAAPKRGVSVTRGQAYGADPLQVLDVYQPTSARHAPVVIFVHGGAYVAGDKDVGEHYGNVATWFARRGLLGINANYRLAPAAPWPAGAQDVGGMVAWAKRNAARFGGDPAHIILVGHSSGATHVAGYIFDTALQPTAGAGVAGAVLISGRYRVVYDPADPYGGNMRTYFGDDPAQYTNRSAITHIRDGAPVPVFLVIAEYEQTGLDLRGAELFAALCERDGACPRFARLALCHNHMSEVIAFNTADELLGREILDFIARGQ